VIAIAARRYRAGVDPRTFLPARRIQVAGRPAIGDAAPRLPDNAHPPPGVPALVAFLRHVGCPFAERTLQLLRDAAAQPHAGDVQFVAISHAAPAATDRWVAAVGGAGPVVVLSDPSRTSYAAWGLGRTTLGHFLGRRSLTAVGALANQGIRNRHPVGTRWQAAGTFALDGDHRVVWRHLPAHAGDLPDLDAALAALS
jgi:hypothetical protein